MLKRRPAAMMSYYFQPQLQTPEIPHRVSVPFAQIVRERPMLPDQI